LLDDINRLMTSQGDGAMEAALIVGIAAPYFVICLLIVVTTIRPHTAEALALVLGAVAKLFEAVIGRTRTLLPQSTDIANNAVGETEISSPELGV
jgi:hypothetical protein